MLGLRDSTATRGRVRVDVALYIFRICHWPARTSIVLGWKRPHLSTPLITPSPLRTKGVHPDPGDGKFTRRARASQCSNLTFLKRCPKLPEQANRHWRNCGPTEPLDGVTGRRFCLNTRRQPASPPCLATVPNGGIHKEEISDLAVHDKRAIDKAPLTGIEPVNLKPGAFMSKEGAARRGAYDWGVAWCR